MTMPSRPDAFVRIFNSPSVVPNYRSPNSRSNTASILFQIASENAASNTAPGLTGAGVTGLPIMKITGRRSVHWEPVTSQRLRVISDALRG
jgi:hypothetical protein